METEDNPLDLHRKHIDRIDKTIQALEAERERLARMLVDGEEDSPEAPHGC